MHSAKSMIPLDQVRGRGCQLLPKRPNPMAGVPFRRLRASQEPAGISPGARGGCRHDPRGEQPAP